VRERRDVGCGRRYADLVNHGRLADDDFTAEGRATEIDLAVHHTLFADFDEGYS